MELTLLLTRQLYFVDSIRPCLLRRASTIAHHHTPEMILRRVIFSTPESGKIIHNHIQNAHPKHTLISWGVLLVAQQAFFFLKTRPVVSNDTLCPVCIRLSLSSRRAYVRHHKKPSVLAWGVSATPWGNRPISQLHCVLPSIKLF